jgi:hypothetical protein
LNQLKNVYAKQLSEAPDNWPWNYGWKDRSPSLEWTSEGLLRYPEKRWEIDLKDWNWIRQRAWEFNGLDYMLLNNLFLITYKNQLPAFKYAK